MIRERKSDEIPKKDDAKVIQLYYPSIFSLHCPKYASSFNKVQKT